MGETKIGEEREECTRKKDLLSTAPSATQIGRTSLLVGHTHCPCVFYHCERQSSLCRAATFLRPEQKTHFSLSKHLCFQVAVFHINCSISLRRNKIYQ